MPYENFRTIADDFYQLADNPLIKDTVKHIFDDLHLEQQIPFNGPRAQNKFCATIESLINTCDNRQIRSAYETILVKHDALMYYMEQHV